MKNVYLLPLIAAVFFVYPTISAQVYIYPDANEKTGLELSRTTDSGIEINFNLHEFELSEMDVNGETMKHINAPGSFLPNEEGAPNLPGYSRFIAIPEGAKPKLTVRNYKMETLRDVKIAPAPQIPLDTDNEPLRYIKNEKIYNTDAYYPAEPFMLSGITEIRGVDAVILGITPFRYNPASKELIIYYDVEIEIRFEGGNGRFGENSLRSRWWDPMLSNAFLNGSSLPTIDYNKRYKNPSDSPDYEYVIITPDNTVFLAWADSIRKFRTLQGIHTGVVTTTEIGGNTVSAIESYVDNAYNSWAVAPSAVLLLGDYSTGTTGITSQMYTHPAGYDDFVSDNKFADVNGDELPDIAFARITANNASQLEVMITKFLDYERNPPVSADFYDHPITALGWQTERWFQVCSEVVGGYLKNEKGKNPVRINAVYDGNPSSDPWSTAPNTSTVLNYFGPNGLGYIPATPQELGGFSGGTATGVVNAINSGSYMLQHRDHGYYQGWGEPAFNTSTINSLNNVNNELPFIFSINCQTGAFHRSSESFAEKFHRYTYNGQNSGALGIIAATEVSYSFVNDTYLWGVFDNLHSDFMPDKPTQFPVDYAMPAFGNAAGKHFLAQSNWPYNTGSKQITYRLFHHHGDAFMQIYSEVPQNLSVNHAPVIYSGETSFSVTADAGSFIALTVDGQIIGTAEGTGSAVSIPIEPQVPPAEMIVTITKQNYFRYESVVEILPPSGPYVVFDSYEINDYTDNNGNGQVDFGETIWLTLTLKNVGVENATGVNAVISSGDPFITITDNSESFGDVPAGGTVTITDAFVFAAGNNIPDQHAINFTLTTSDQRKTSWESYFTIIAHAPDLNFAGYIVDDSGGNNNGILDPGETAPVEITIENNGGSAAANIEGALSTTDPYLTIQTTSPQSYGDLNPGQSAYAVFTVTADAGTPGGHISEAMMDITADQGISQQETVEFSFADYCYPSANCSWGDGFTGFALGDISNLNSGCSTDGYGDFLSMSTDLEAGGTYTVQWKTGYSNQYACLWIDLNNNREFETDERLITDFHMSSSGTLYSTSFTVPSDAYGGNKRMRIRANWQNSASNPCSDFSYGETEDYTVMISSVDPPVADFNASQTIVTEGESITFTDLSTNNPTEWAWTFPGGTPSASTDQDPVVTYNTAGSYSVTLTATNGGGSDTKSKANYIQVVSLPQCADPVSPANGATDILITMGLKWSSAANATGYKLYFGTDYPPTNIENGTNLGNVMIYNPGGLNYETVYYWQIIPYNAYGEAQGCAVWSFSTETEPVYPPDCPALIAPDDNGTEIPVTTNLEWNSSTGADGYRIFFGTDNPPTNIENGTDLGNSTAYTPTTDLDYTTTYYWQLMAYNDGGTSESCAVWSFNTEDDPDPPAHFQPVWTSPFNPMNIFVTEALWDGNDLQPGDEIGLFDTDPASGSEICVGAGTLTEVLNNGNFLEIIASMDDGTNPDQANGFTPGNEMKFKYWNSIAGEYEPVMISFPYQGYDEVYTSQGNAFVQLSTTSSMVQNIPLNSGWNMVSFMVEPDNPDMMSIMQPLIDQELFYKIIDENGGSVFHLPFPPPNGQWSNTIGDMACTEGYYLKVYDNCNLITEGTEASLPMDIQLIAGWNMISYPCTEPSDAMVVVQDLIDAGVLYKVVDENGGTVFHLPFPPPDGQWSNTIGNFEAGEGYYMKVTEDIMLTIDEPAKNSLFTGTIAYAPVQYFQPVYQNNPYMPMHIILDTNGNLNPGDEIGVFDGDVCVGAAVFDGNEVIVTCSANDPETTEINGFISGNTFEIKVWNKETNSVYVPDDLIYLEGDETFAQLGTGIYQIDKLTGIQGSVSNMISVAIHPNPVKDIATITLSLHQRGNLKLEISDIFGNIISDLGSVRVTSGYQSIELNTESLAGGYYLLTYRFENPENQTEGYQKFIVIK